jgi:hypothetical protein
MVELIVIGHFDRARILGTSASPGCWGLSPLAGPLLIHIALGRRRLDPARLIRRHDTQMQPIHMP